MVDQKFLAQDAAQGLFIDPVAFQQQLDDRFLLRLLQAVQFLHLLAVEQVALVEHDRQLAAIGHRQFRQGVDFVVFLAVFRLQGTVFPDQVVLLQRQRYRDAQIVVVPRLEDELVDRALVDRAHHRSGVGMAGEHDADHVGVQFPGLAQQFAAGHARHHEIGNDQVEGFLAQQVERILAVEGRDDVVVFLAEYALQRLQHVGFVVHQKQAVALLRRKLLKFLNQRGSYCAHIDLQITTQFQDNKTGLPWQRGSR